MKNFYGICFLTALMLSLSGCEVSPGVPTMTNLSAALDRAKAENKPIVLDFHASWCGPCKEMDRETFHDPKIVSLLKNCILVKIDVDQQSSLAQDYGISSIPNVRLILPNGTEHKELVGYQDVSTFSFELAVLLETAGLPFSVEQ